MTGSRKTPPASPATSRSQRRPRQSQQTPFQWKSALTEPALRQYGHAGFPSSCTELALIPATGFDANGYYKLFGLETTATPQEIRRAYVRLAKEHHPDKGGDVEGFRMITQIYETLIDPARRQIYDNTDSTIEGMIYLGEMEVEELKKMIPRDDWGQFMSKRSSGKKAAYSYFAHQQDDELAQAWFDVLLPAFQASGISMDVRISLENTPWPRLRNFPTMPEAIVIPTTLKPSYFVALLLVQALREDMGMI